MHGSANTIERDLLSRRRAPPDLAGAFEVAFAAALGPGGTVLPTALHTAGRAVATAMDAAADRLGDLPYHGRHHTVDAVVTMGLLCQAAVRQRMITPRCAACGIVAMAGHDIYHDGSPPGGGRLERQSRQAVEAIAAASGVGLADVATIGAMILATDPDTTAENAARFAGTLPPGRLGAEQDALNKLANEADICGSLLPRLGPLLGIALAEEWRPLADPALADVATATGRLAFLLAVPALSPPATALGLGAAVAECLAAYTAIGATLGTPTPQAGCAWLDSLPPDAAAASYAAALARPVCAGPRRRPDQARP